MRVKLHRVKRIDLNVLEAQLAKRQQNLQEYDRRISDEMRDEQLEFYQIIRRLAERFADENYQRDTREWQALMERFMFTATMTYKFISVGIESRWMNEDIRL